MNQIGRKLTLWKLDRNPKAYKDQHGISHPGYVVLEQIPVEIVEEKPVPGDYGGTGHYGWRAAAEDGRQFLCNWESFPETTMTPALYWQRAKPRGGYSEYVDAKQALNMRYAFGPFVTPRGGKIKPLNLVLCKKHNYYYYPDNQLRCVSCECEALENE